MSRPAGITVLVLICLVVVAVLVCVWRSRRAARQRSAESGKDAAVTRQGVCCWCAEGLAGCLTCCCARACCCTRAGEPTPRSGVDAAHKLGLASPAGAQQADGVHVAALMSQQMAMLAMQQMQMQMQMQQQWHRGHPLDAYASVHARPPSTAVSLPPPRFPGRFPTTAASVVHGLGPHELRPGAPASSAARGTPRHATRHDNPLFFQEIPAPARPAPH